MTLDKSLYIHSGRDGVLGDTTEEDVRKLVGALKVASKVAIHVHGGLVSKANALAHAETLAPAYLKAGVQPVFIVWESSFFETIKNNLHEINKEAVFQALVKRILQYAVGKLTQTDGEKAGLGGIRTPTDIEVSKEMLRRQANEVPYKGLVGSAPSEVSDSEQRSFEAALAADKQFESAVLDIIATRQPSYVEGTSKGVATRVRGSATTLMSKDVIEELTADPEAKGVVATITLVKKAAKILVRVVKRLHDGRDHGVYTTVVEEVLRELYIDNVGSFIWGAMKKETSDAFQPGASGQGRAGTTLMRELGALLQSGHKPEISFVGHSAGAIYGCHMLKHVAQLRRAQALPHDFRLKNLLMLAPACRFDLFGEVLDEHERLSLFENFRTYALNDALESGYWEIPVVYPRSLLYFVSGVVELDGKGGAFDSPLLGMQRYYLKTDVYADAAIDRIRRFVLTAGNERQAVWSEDPRTDGLGADSLKHGGFDDLTWPDGRPARSMESVLHVLSKGW